MASQKNKRLSKHDRDILSRFAKQQIEKTESSDTLDAAYERAATAIAVAVEAAYPAKDMKVLAKYEMASADKCIYVSVGGNGDYSRFCFRKGDQRIPLRPDRYCRRQPIMLKGEGGAAFAEYTAADEERETVVKQRLADFRALIFNTTTFNALAEVWPAVEALRAEIVGSSAALSIMSDEVVARIKADPVLAEAA